jgi:hypothetical protein
VPAGTLYILPIKYDIFPTDQWASPQNVLATVFFLDIHLRTIKLHERPLENMQFLYKRISYQGAIDYIRLWITLLWIRGGSAARFSSVNICNQSFVNRQKLCSSLLCVMCVQEVVSSELVNSQFFVVDCRKGATVSKFVIIVAHPLCCGLKLLVKKMPLHSF